MNETMTHFEDETPFYDEMSIVWQYFNKSV